MKNLRANSPLDLFKNQSSSIIVIPIFRDALARELIWLCILKNKGESDPKEEGVWLQGPRSAGRKSGPVSFFRLPVKSKTVGVGQKLSPLARRTRAQI